MRVPLPPAGGRCRLGAEQDGADGDSDSQQKFIAQTSASGYSTAVAGYTAREIAAEAIFEASLANAGNLTTTGTLRTPLKSAAGVMVLSDRV